MNKRIFDLGLYREAFRQGKLVGLMATILFTLEAVLLPIGAILDEIRYEQNLHMMPMDEYIREPQILELMEMHPLILLTICVATPLLVLFMFHFLTKRNACDFYHAIPQPRACVFWSFFGAAMTWIVIFTVVPTLLGAGVFALFPKYFIINVSNVCHMLFNMLAGNLLVAAAIAMAVCLTGTAFTNIIVTGLILFVPRIFIMVMTVGVSSLLPMVPSNQIFPLLDFHYNVVFGMFVGLFLGGFETCFTQLASGLYTLALGLIYTFVAMKLFCWRRSEAAGQAAATRRLQLVYRLVVSMLICLAPCYYLFNIFIGYMSLDMMDIYTCFVMYVLALAAYFLYELITTRKWRNLAKAVPGLGLLALMNVFVNGAMCGLYTSALNTTPEAEDIKWISVIQEPGGTFYNHQFYDDYFAAKVGVVKLEDLLAKERVAARLEENVEAWKESKNRYYKESEDCDRIEVEICTGLRTIRRYVYLSEADQRILVEALEKDADYQSAYRDLPQLGKGSTLCVTSQLSREKSEELYQILQEEAAEMDLYEWVSLLNDQKYGPTVFDQLTLVTNIGTKTYASEIPISSAMPKTAAAYLQFYNEAHHTDRAIMIDIFEELAKSKEEEKKLPYSDIYINIQLVGDIPWEGTEKEPKQADIMPAGEDIYAEDWIEPYRTLYYYIYEGVEADSNYIVPIEIMAKVLLKNKDQAIRPDGLYARVDVDAYPGGDKDYKEEGDYFYSTCYFSLEEADLRELGIWK